MIPEESRRILTGRRNAWLATLMPDGAPHLTPIWIDVEGDEIVFTTSEETVKVANLRKDPRVALAIESEEDRYRIVTVRGRVVGIEPEGTDRVNAMSRRHDGHDWEETEPGTRVLVRILPDRVTLQQD